MTSLDWRHYGIIALLLACLASWGAREKVLSEQTQSLRAERQELARRAEAAETLARSLREQMSREQSRQSEHVRTRAERRLPDGTTEILDTERASTMDRTREEIRREVEERYAAMLAEAQHQVQALRIELDTMRAQVIRSAPRWAVMVGYDTLRVRAGLGANIGPLTALVSAVPSELVRGAVLAARPQAEVILRY
jgi:exonuclease VII large subunit